MALAQDPQPVGEALIEEAVFHHTENFRVQTDGMFGGDHFLVSLAIRDAIILGVPRQFYMTTIIPTVASSQPIASRDDGSAPPGTIAPAMVSSTTGLSNNPDEILATPGFYTPDVSPGTMDPNMEFSTPGPSTAPDRVWATPGLYSADSGIALSLPRSSSPRGSVPHGTIDPAMVFSTPGPSTASDGALARPGLNTADSGIDSIQPSSSRPYGSVCSGTMSSKSEGRMADQASSFSVPDSVFSTPAPSTAHDRAWTSTTPSGYTSHGIARSQPNSSGPHGSVPTGTKRSKINVNMVGRRTMSSTAQGKMVARQPSNPARHRMVSSQGSTSSALDRVLSTPGPSGAPSGQFTDSCGSLGSKGTFLAPHTRPPGARREANSLMVPATATPPTPSATSSRPLPPATASMTGVRRRIRDTCSEMGIPLILASLQDGSCIPMDEEILDAMYAVHVITQLAWARTSFKVAAITQDRVLANEVALDTLKKVLEAAMKVKEEDLVVATTKHWLNESTSRLNVLGLDE
ncbi:hypothetical protein B0T18DRAFT_430144 [Schizothecium vesticola]|uniref:Uncharacterized protein n=1 Tax=Schizothecium vesticola TaxID=314040 RepID=A0AA40K1N0_9PEZI|nr:hypothetical protein B0T18DRAFT_430144 [Schizothecium vesticola]